MRYVITVYGKSTVIIINNLGSKKSRSMGDFEKRVGIVISC